MMFVHETLLAPQNILLSAETSSRPKTHVVKKIAFCLLLQGKTKYKILKVQLW